MRVAFISRATLYTAPGGDTRQIDATAGALRQLGVEVDIFPTSQQPDYSRYDLLHFFNIIRPADMLYHIQKAGLPYVVSTIFVDYGVFEKKNQGGFRKLITRLFSDDGVEYLKALARRFKNGERLKSRSYLLRGHARSIRKVAEGALALLPNSESEYRRFVARYGVERPYRVIPNGINATAANGVQTKIPQYENAVLCMARIEPIKNQLSLIRALSGTPLQLFIHGKPSPNHAAYYEACRREAGPNIHILPWVEDEKEIYRIYASAKVHVLPSHFETTGLSSLEAAVMGCNVVVTDCGDVRDYFADHAWYANPDDIVSIREAVLEAHAAPYEPQFRQHILDHYTWQRAGEETLKAYRDALPHLFQKA